MKPILKRIFQRNNGRVVCGDAGVRGCLSLILKSLTFYHYLSQDTL